MTALSTSYDVKSYDVTTLAAGITATQTAGIKLNVVSVNGADSAWATTTGGVIEVKQETVDGVKVEYIAYGGGTVNADNTFTLSDVSRNVSRSGTSLTGTGTGQRFNRGAPVRLVNFHVNFNKKANVDRDSGFTVKQSFNKGVRHVPFADATARDAYFTAPAEGDECFITAVGKQVYSGGAWVTTNATSNTAMTSTAAGTGELGVVADLEAATGAGTSGAPVVIPASLAKVASAGAGDRGKVVIRGTDGLVDTTNLGTGSASSSKYLRGDKTWANNPSDALLFGDGSEGAYTLDVSQAAVGGLLSLSGTTFSLLKDAQFTDLTIAASYKLNTNGYKLRWTGTLTLSDTGVDQIISNGGAGTAGVAAVGTTAGTAGAAGTAAHTGGTLPDALAGKAGGDGGGGGTQNNVGSAATAGTAGSNQTACLGTTGVAGGAGGAGGTGNGGGIAGGASGGAGAGGTATAVTTVQILQNAFLGLYYTVTTISLESHAGSGSGGGGGGGGGGTSGPGGGGGGGGGSGGGGGHIDAAGNVITGGGNIAAKGGAGGNGGDGANANAGSTNGGGGGAGAAGAGGPGGVVKLAYRTKSGWSGSASVAGGAAGSAGAVGTKVGTGVNGSAASAATAGATGYLFEFQIK